MASISSFCPLHQGFHRFQYLGACKIDIFVAGKKKMELRFLARAQPPPQGFPKRRNPSPGRESPTLCPLKHLHIRALLCPVPTGCGGRKHKDYGHPIQGRQGRLIMAALSWGTVRCLAPTDFFYKFNDVDSGFIHRRIDRAYRYAGRGLLVLWLTT